jgi:aspartate oxidase
MQHKYLLTILAVFILLSSAFAQRHERMKPMQKMEELKKIKLIEILQMDEETSIKFFTRRSEHMKRMENQNQISKEKMDQLDEMLTDRKENSDQVLKKAIDEYLQIQENIMRERQNFFKSANEILTVEQMAKLVVFEEKFRNEVSGLLFRERFKKQRED